MLSSNFEPTFYNSLEEELKKIKTSNYISNAIFTITKNNIKTNKGVKKLVSFLIEGDDTLIDLISDKYNIGDIMTEIMEENYMI